ncbi:MAG: hypothetical protein JSV21_07615 [Nitrospirota bacterium]|nr:MAG: hypothetical protein JSV21_07615 [Nitrospirota bacterium]
MRLWISIITLLIAIYLIAGGGYVSIISDHQIEASVTGIKEEAGKVFGTAKDIAAKTREKIRERLRSEHKAIRSEISDISGRIGEASGVEKDVLGSRLKRLEKKEKAIAGKLRKLDYTDVSFWKGLKKRYDSMVHDIKEAWQVLAEWIGNDKDRIKITL